MEKNNVTTPSLGRGKGVGPQNISTVLSLELVLQATQQPSMQEEPTLALCFTRAYNLVDN